VSVREKALESVKFGSAQFWWRDIYELPASQRAKAICFKYGLLKPRDELLPEE